MSGFARWAMRRNMDRAAPRRARANMDAATHAGVAASREHLAKIEPVDPTRNSQSGPRRKAI